MRGLAGAGGRWSGFETLGDAVFGLCARGLLVVVMAALLVHGPSLDEAAAHTGLESSAPADGEALTGAPETLGVTLTFSEDVQAEFAQVAVTGPDGESVASGPVVVEGAVVRQPVDLDVEGAYVVAYRVVSSDGHPVSGQLAFTVRSLSDSGAGTSSAPSPPSASPAPSPSGVSVSPAAGRDGGSGSGSGWLVLAVTGVLIAAGLGALEWLRRGRTDG